MKKVRMIVVGILSCLCLAFLSGHTSQAAGEEKVNVTIPSDLTIVFKEDGTEGIGEFCVRNQSLVPVTLDSVYVTENNGWKLVPEDSEILVNTRKLAFQIGGYPLQAGSNNLHIPISQEAEKVLKVAVKRGAWDKAEEVESAFVMEFTYTIGKANFQLSFDANGGSKVSSVTVNNGEQVNLPVSVKDGYDLVGWEDADGKLYTDLYTMPIGNTILTARWALKKAYAIYSADDHSLTFYNTSKTIKAGNSYNGKKVTAVYTDFLDKGYAYQSEAPWCVDYGLDIKKIVVADKISPTITQGWFLYLRNCEYIDVTKMDMSRVTNMKQMFSLTGNYATTFKLLGMKNWDVSNVTDMSSVFNGVGRNATTFYIDDISGWDVSKVTTMYSMFVNTGRNVTNWSLDLRGWNVKRVTNHNSFDTNCAAQVIDPIWVN